MLLQKSLRAQILALLSGSLLAMLLIAPSKRPRRLKAVSHAANKACSK